MGGWVGELLPYLVELIEVRPAFLHAGWDELLYEVHGHGRDVEVALHNSTVGEAEAVHHRLSIRGGWVGGWVDGLLYFFVEWVIECMVGLKGRLGRWMGELLSYLNSRWSIISRTGELRWTSPPFATM